MGFQLESAQADRHISITAQTDEEEYGRQILRHFHPQGLRCPHCKATPKDGYFFRITQKSKLIVYRCRCCQGIYNLYSQTIFEARHLRPSQVVGLIKAVLNGDSAATIAHTLKIGRSTAIEWCQLLKSEAEHLRLRSFFSKEDIAQ